MSSRLEEIAERNRRALRVMDRRRGWLRFLQDEVNDAFDPAVARDTRRPKQLALATVVLLVIGAIVAFVLWPSGPDRGGTVLTRQGDKIRLAQLWDNRRVVVVFYPGRGCDCDEMLQTLDAARARFAADVVAITSQTPAVADNVHERLKLGYEIYVDPTFEIMRAWSVPFAIADATKWAIFIVEPGGAISFKQIGEPLPSWDELAKQTLKTS